MVAFQADVTISVYAGFTVKYGVFFPISVVHVLKAMEIGYPMAGAKVETATGEPLDENASYAEGDFRLKFLVSTKDGVAEAYVTLALKREINM